MNKAPTIHDVASALGMHKSTVSLALSGKGNISARTRARVQSAAQQLGYEPNPLAQRLATGTGSPTVCLFSGALDVGLATEKILLIQKALSARGLEVPIYTCADLAGEARHPQVAQVRQLCRHRPRAIICASQRVDPDVFAELSDYQAAGGVVVSYDTPVPLACDQVIFDREDNAYRAARHLLECGHRRIGFGMTDTADLPGAEAAGSPQAERLRGFRRALEEFGAPAREDWVFRNATYERGGSGMARHFLEMSERPTGVSIVNDYVALAFMVEVMRAGVRVPGDVSIVSHDDQPITDYCPVPLTSVSQPTGRIADAVVDLLRERLAGSVAAPQTVIVRGELVLRDSVGPPMIS